jgi:uncharacterized protein with GYD domain
MPTYVTLVKFTAKGPHSISDFGDAWEETAEAIGDLGINITGVFGVLGPYDMMILYDAVDQKTAAKLPLSIAARKEDISTETWTTIPLDEYVRIGQRIVCEWRPQPSDS